MPKGASSGLAEKCWKTYCWEKGEMMLLQGQVLACEQVKNEKSGKYSSITRVLEQGRQPQIYIVRDYENRIHTVGEQVEIRVFADVYVGKRGPMITWIASKDQNGNGKAAGLEVVV